VAREALARVAATLTTVPGRQVLINGHTDNSGPENLNRALSLDRAQRCSEWLEGHGVDPARMEIQGFGSSRPVGGDRSPEAQAHNRRVEIDLR
jgi:outer membrane protein OmpA-like peptidoglycan-associated protein